MPTQPNEGGRGLERRASDALTPEKRTETAGHPATRRKVLSMVTGGIAATAVVGTAAASKRPTVFADSETCGVIDLAYTRHGPTVAVDIFGDALEEPYTVELEANGSDQVPVPAGEYDVHARPARANGGSSVPVEGPPIPVSECGVDVSLVDCNDMYLKIKIENPSTNDACVPVEVISKRGGNEDSHVHALGPGDDVTPLLLFPWFDEWVIHAYTLPATGDCKDTTGSTVPINGESSPLRLTGNDCSSLTVEEGSLEGV